MNIPLYTYDDMPDDMRQYLSFHGWHFTRRACDYAVSRMRRTKQDTTQQDAIQPLTREQVDDMLTRHNITITNLEAYDHVYLANMCRADYYGSAIEDDLHLCRFIKDTLDDPDAPPDSTMICWYAKMHAAAKAIPWHDLM